MKPQEEKQKFAESQGARKKPRFKIEKLEERIAPRYFYNVNAGKYVGGHRRYPCGRDGCR